MGMIRGRVEPYVEWEDKGDMERGLEAIGLIVGCVFVGAFAVVTSPLWIPFWLIGFLERKIRTRAKQPRQRSDG